MSIDDAEKRPMINIKRITYISHAQFYSAKADDCAAVIYIDNPPAYPPKFNGYAGGLSLAFADYVPRSKLEIFVAKAKVSTTTKIWVGKQLFGSRWRPMLTNDAQSIHDFLQAMDKSQIERIVCVCEYGKSRSRAVAEYLARRLYIKATGDTSGTANPWVLDVLSSI